VPGGTAWPSDASLGTKTCPTYRACNQPPSMSSVHPPTSPEHPIVGDPDQRLLLFCRSMSLYVWCAVCEDTDADGFHKIIPTNNNPKATQTRCRPVYVYHTPTEHFKPEHACSGTCLWVPAQAELGWYLTHPTLRSPPSGLELKEGAVTQICQKAYQQRTTFKAHKAASRKRKTSEPTAVAVADNPPRRAPQAGACICFLLQQKSV